MKKIYRWQAAALFVLCLAGCGSMKDAINKGDVPDASIQPEIKLEETETEGDVSDASIQSEIKLEEAETEIEAQPNRIVCWGDSLTYGEGGNGVTYPSVLEEKTNLEVINYGIQGETARQIGIRMGLLPMTTGTFEIPEETVPTTVSLWQQGEDPTMMRLGDCGINPCEIGGVEGTLSYREEDHQYYFTRTVAGDAVEVAEGMQVNTFASQDKKDGDIVILFAGSNLPPSKDTVGELIDIENKMLEYLDAKRYLVIGLTSKALVPDVEEINMALAEAFGEHFLDIRKHLLKRGLSDAGLVPTKQDQADLEAGEIPSALRVDVVHGNEAFYRIIGEQVYQKLKALGYVI